MPDFNQQTLLEQGPIVEAEIFASEEAFLRFKNFSSPESFVRVKLLIDTGSNISGLDRSFIRMLSLQPYPDTDEWVLGEGGSWKVERYGCVLYLPIFKKKALTIEVLEGDFSGSQVHGILGRDILQYCDFRYDGIKNEFRLEAKGF